MQKILNHGSITTINHLGKEKTMIKLKQLASNMTCLYKDGNEILFSYQTPVAVYDVKRGEYLRTETKFSQTTSRHINKWLQGVNAISVPQSIIEGYVR